jgi:hypothetical protein
MAQQVLVRHIARVSAGKDNLLRDRIQAISSLVSSGNPGSFGFWDGSA